MTDPTTGIAPTPTVLSGTLINPTAPTVPTVPTQPTAPTPPTPAPELSDLAGGWQISPDQLSKFASAVQQVRADLNAVLKQVDQLTSPSYQPQLGSSPVGQALAAKFVDRLSGDQGLLPSLTAVLTHLDAFIANAEQTASQYQGTDTATADTLKSL